jgi:hypothetical protein
MATTKTRTRRAARTAAHTEPKRKTTTKTTNGASRTADAATVAARRDTVRKRVIDGGESAAVVAKDLGITSGKAAFIKMQLMVEDGNVPAIKFKNPDDMVTKTVAARNKADEYSSWGWLSARTGVSEPSLKAAVAAAGHNIAGEKIASIRKANRPAKSPAAAKKTASTRAKSARTTRTRTRRAQADPS